MTHESALVILGNPPYGISKQNALSGFVDAYKEVKGEPLGERNVANLQCDYVKFIRFAQLCMDSVPRGVVALITNNAFLDGVTFRGMRASLLETFDQIRILDLHGNKRRKEKTPEGVRDEGVFDIMCGTCITFLIKNPTLPKGVFYTDLIGSRKEKLQTLENFSWREDYPFKALSSFDNPFYFKPIEIQDRYKTFWSLRDIFQVSGSSLATHKDKLALGFDEQELSARLQDFSSLSPEQARAKYALGEDTVSWTVERAQKEIREHQPYPLRKVLYRCGDERFMGFTGRKGLVGHPSSISKHLLSGSNIALVIPRKREARQSTPPWITDKPSALGGHHLFPLYV